MKKLIILLAGIVLGVGLSMIGDDDAKAVTHVPISDIDATVLVSFNYGMATGGGMALYSLTKNASQTCSYIVEHINTTIKNNENAEAFTDPGKMAVTIAEMQGEAMVSKGLNSLGIDCPL